MAENDLSRDIIVPLFKEIFSSRVEFSGGGIEKGRDIIVYKKDEFGDNEFIGIQVKKIKLTPNSSTNSFQQLLNQLAQMQHEGVVDPDSGEKISIKKRIFITPYPISDKTYDSHQGAYRDIISQGIKIIDGESLAKLISKHTPELARKIIGDTTYIGDLINPKLSNKTLMNALNFSETKQLCDIYCETSLIAGNKNRSKSGYTTRYKAGKNEINVKLSDAPLISKHNQTLKNHLCVDLFNTDDFNNLEVSHTRNILLENEISKIGYHINKINRSISNVVTDSFFVDKYPNVTSNEFNEFIKNGFTAIEAGEYRSLLLKEIAEIDELLIKRDDLLKKNSINRGEKSSIPATFNIRINNTHVVNAVDSKMAEMQNFTNVNSINIRDYLNISSSIERCHLILDQYKDVFLQEEYPVSGINISISDAFDTGLNIIVLGEAGSGKTTNLQYHAKRLYNNPHHDGLVIYMTLNELASLSSKNDDQCIISGLKRYFDSIGLSSYSEQQITSLLTNKRNTLLLDSIDEAISQYGWIISLLKEFSTKYAKCQIITSSRYTVSEISELGFTCISLLPFNHQQKKNFFDKWFSATPEKSTAIITHLNKNSELDRIITNPLSATIMAILQDNNVPLPKTESSLYKKRFELLSGLFDRFKGINRMSLQPETLLSAARLLAFQMHKKKVRSTSKDSIISFFNENLLPESQETSIQYAEMVVQELISPSEILLLNNDGRYSFGHLRFQEFLASEQLVHVRTLQLEKLLTDPWWHDVFILYSQHAHDIKWIVDDSCKNGYSSSVHKLLKQMLNQTTMPKDKSEKLLRRVEISVSDELRNEPSRTIMDMDDLSI
ncbi:NACHT domain-containing protein [Aeromonas veronii]|uniref:NACHT domain-containing protein n=1 Tax=Aeromonas veronii TaxID=654 RepID=UPI003A253FC9